MTESQKLVLYLYPPIGDRKISYYMPRGIPRDQSIQHAIIHRLKITRGHLDKVIRMVEQGEYCIDIIHQALAVQAGLQESSKIVLKNHMETCVAQEIQKGNKEEVIAEIMKVMDKLQ